MKFVQTKELSKSNNWYRLILQRTAGSEMDRILALSMAFSIALVMARIAYTGKLTFIWMIWNLFLAWVPYRISSWLQRQSSIKASKWKFAAVSIVWLLFIPNAFYILTDLFHLGVFHNVPNWFDLTLIISFAWNGLLLGILSVRQMEKIMQIKQSYSLIQALYPSNIAVGLSTKRRCVLIAPCFIEVGSKK
jgi:uncharacterized membrane protein